MASSFQSLFTSTASSIKSKLEENLPSFPPASSVSSKLPSSVSSLLSAAKSQAVSSKSTTTTDESHYENNTNNQSLVLSEQVSTVQQNHKQLLSLGKEAEAKLGTSRYRLMEEVQSQQKLRNTQKTIEKLTADIRNLRILAQEIQSNLLPNVEASLVASMEHGLALETSHFVSMQQDRLSRYESERIAKLEREKESVFEAQQRKLNEAFHRDLNDYKVTGAVPSKAAIINSSSSTSPKPATLEQVELENLEIPMDDENFYSEDEAENEKYLEE